MSIIPCSTQRITCYNRRMANNTLSGQTNSQEIRSWWAPLFIAAAVVIFVINGWAWWHFVRSNPERTFYASLENSLRTQGLTRTVEQASNGQSLEQGVQLNVGSQHVARSESTIKQEGEVNATIKTEQISTPKQDFVRYTTIDTTQKGENGQDLDFSELLGLWGKSDVADQTGAAGELYNESVLGVVPVGNLRSADRQAIMKFIKEKNVYTVDGKSVKRDIKNGRPVYTYEVTVTPEAYIGMLKLFGKAVGLKQLENVDPASYKDTEPLTFLMDVDVWGRQLSSISFGAGERTESFGSYGVARSVVLPKESVPLDELQARLQAVQ